MEGRQKEKYVCVYACVHGHMCMNMYIGTCALMYVFMHAQYMCMYIHIYTHLDLLSTNIYSICLICLSFFFFLTFC